MRAARMPVDLFSAARDCLKENNLEKKIQLSTATVKRCRQGFSLKKVTVESTHCVGRPCKPRLVPPKALPRRGFGTQQARLSLLHAIAHIEFNAINLAWDAIYRFQDMPEDYYWDYLQVAQEETGHFSLLRTHLNRASYDYGDFDAHDGLWTMAENTAEDVLHRMAIIPGVLEARGLDVTPAMIKKFADTGETEIVETLETIYREEIGHVRTGIFWFRYICSQRGLEAESTFIQLIKQYQLDEFRGGLNKAARIEAGFSQQQLDFLEAEFVGN